VTTLHGYA